MPATTLTTPSRPHAPAAPGGGRLRRGRAERGDRRFNLLLMAPAVLVVLALFAYPIGYAGWLSLHQWNDKISPVHPYTGTDNYHQLFSDPAYHEALNRTVYFSAITVLAGVALAIGLAVLLTQQFRFRALARVLLLVPWAVPPVVNGIMWHLIFDGDTGIANTVLRGLGIIDGNKQWLSSPTSAMNVLIFAEMWKLLPFLTLLFIAALQSVPANLYRAASIDGAGAIRRFAFITLPSIRTTILFALIVQSMWSLKVFDTIYVLTGGSGGPAGGTTTINFFAYLTTFSNLDRGYGAAIAISIMALVLLIAVFWMLLFRAPSWFVARGISRRGLSGRRPGGRGLRRRTA
jgi:ABC-type sugar transport system permease subunit